MAFHALARQRRVDSTRRWSATKKAHHVVPSELQHPAYRVADDGTTEVAHVHLLRNIGTGEVHDNSLPLRNPGRGTKRFEGSVMYALRVMTLPRQV